MFFLVIKQFLSVFDGRSEMVSTLSMLFLISAIIESSLVIYQWFNLIILKNFNYRLLGSFNNPGVLAIYLGSAFVFSLSLYCSSTEASIKDKLIKNLSGIYILLAIIILPATQSRTACISAIITGLLVITVKYKSILLRLSKFRYLIGITVFLALATICIFLYQYKKDSADGRIVIWDTTTILIKRNFLTGIGFQQFQNKFPDFQSEYFKTHQEDSVKFPDKDDYAFNDFMQILAENGIVGLMLFVIFLFTLFRLYFNTKSSNKWIRASQFGVLFILISALTSYPFEIVPIWFVFIFFILIISTFSEGKTCFKMNKVLTGGMVIAGCLFCFYQLYMQRNLIIARTSIASARQDIDNEKYSESVKHFETALKYSPSEKRILLELGKSYLLMNNNKQCIQLLTGAQRYISDPFLSSNLAEACENIGDFHNSEFHFQNSINMMPNRMYPQYMLVKMYIKSKQYDKAKKMAEKVINMPVKVESPATREMKLDISRLLKTDIKR